MTSGSAGSPGSWPCGCNCRRLNAGPALRRLVDDALADAARSAGAVLVLRADDDDAGVKAGGAGFWAAATLFEVILLAGLGDLSAIMTASFAAWYHHDLMAVGIGSVLALWAVTAVAVLGGQGLLKILPLRWVTRLAALVMVVMAGFTLARRCGNAPSG